MPGGQRALSMQPGAGGWVWEREREQQILQIMSFPSWMDDLVSIQYTQTPGSGRMEKDNQQLHWWNRVVYTEQLCVKHRVEKEEGLVGTWRLLGSLILHFCANAAVLPQDVKKKKKALFCHSIMFLGCQWIHWDWGRIGIELIQPLWMTSPWFLGLRLGRTIGLGLTETSLAHHNLRATTKAKSHSWQDVSLWDVYDTTVIPKSKLNAL